MDFSDCVQSSLIKMSCLIAGAVLFIVYLAGLEVFSFIWWIKHTSIKHVRQFIKFTVLTDYNFGNLSSILVQLLLTSNQRPLLN